jgi:LCP family protein required for cell wall assembly
LGWTVWGTILPGLGLLRAKRPWAGAPALLLAVAAGAGLVYLARHRQLAVEFLAQADWLRLAAGGLGLLALAWAALSVVTYRSLAPRGLSVAQRLAAGAVVLCLVLGLSTPMAIGARYALVQANLISTVFGDSLNQSVTLPTFTPGTDGDPWANTPRVNILLLGYDRGLSLGRTEAQGGLTDTIMVASIDTKTGNTVLTSLPRNTARMPFPTDSPLYDEFPRGWYNGYDADNLEWMLNTMYHNLPRLVSDDVIGPTANLGADAVKLSVGQALGVKIDYYILVNIDGATQLIDAIGGITININKRIPTDFGWLEPGPDQHLNGTDAVQYARSRKADDDFHRMSRQRCVINAIVRQADMATILTRYEAIATAGTQMVRTDIPATMLPALLQLALRVRDGQLSGMQFTSGENGFRSSNPDFALMAQRFAEAIAASTAVAPAPSTSAPPIDPSGQPVPPDPPASVDPPANASDTQDMTDFCAYNP